MTDVRPGARDIGLCIGRLPTGRLNAITDVPDVRVGHISLIRGEGPLIVGQGPVRTGVTAIVPHGGNLYTDRVCAAVHVINGFGKTVGLPQVTELGQIESPILLTSTLSAWRVADALCGWMAEQNPTAHTFNPLVGECNDAGLNDAVGRHVTAEHVRECLQAASGGGVAEGNVGAGVGMRGFGWKAGIGTASRTVQEYHVGALVLTNTGAAQDLRIDGIPVGRHLGSAPTETAHGSIIILIATDAPMDARQLKRLARRGALGLGRTGATASHSSGDFVIAFSTGYRISSAGEVAIAPPGLIPEPHLTEFFTAAVEAVEEAIINSILRCETMSGCNGATFAAIPLDELDHLLRKHGAIDD